MNEVACMRSCSTALVVFVCTEKHRFVVLEAEKLPQSASVSVKRAHTSRSAGCAKMRIDAGASSPHLLSLLATGNISLRGPMRAQGERCVLSLVAVNGIF